MILGPLKYHPNRYRQNAAVRENDAQSLHRRRRRSRSPTSQLITSAMLGSLRSDPNTRSEFLRLCGNLG
jgi:GTP cyclohydrolase I